MEAQVIVLSSPSNQIAVANNPHDTLYLYKANNSSANLDLGNLTAHGNIAVTSRISCFALQGTVGPFCIMPASGQGVIIGGPSATFITLQSGSGQPVATSHNTS